MWSFLWTLLLHHLYRSSNWHSIYLIARELNSQQFAMGCQWPKPNRVKSQQTLLDMAVGQQEKTYGLSLYLSISPSTNSQQPQKNNSSSIANISLWKCKCYHSWDVAVALYAETSSDHDPHVSVKVQAVTRKLSVNIVMGRQTVRKTAWITDPSLCDDRSSSEFDPRKIQMNWNEK